MKKSEENLRVINNFIEYFTSDEAERERMKQSAASYIKEDHVDGEPADKEERLYLIKDLSGRGYSTTADEEELIQMHKADDEEDEEQSHTGETVQEWLDTSPEIGETWENESTRITRTK